MPAEFICDGCGARAPGQHSQIGPWIPENWYSDRTPNGTWLYACTLACTRTIDNKILSQKMEGL